MHGHARPQALPPCCCGKRCASSWQPRFDADVALRCSHCTARRLVSARRCGLHGSRPAVCANSGRCCTGTRTKPWRWSLAGLPGRVCVRTPRHKHARRPQQQHRRPLQLAPAPHDAGLRALHDRGGPRVHFGVSKQVRSYRFCTAFERAWLAAVMSRDRVCTVADGAYWNAPQSGCHRPTASPALAPWSVP